MTIVKRVYIYIYIYTHVHTYIIHIGVCEGFGVYSFGRGKVEVMITIASMEFWLLGMNATDSGAIQRWTYP